MAKTRVGVLRGGPSGEYDVSLKTGGHVLKHLPDKYQPIDIFISKDGAWHVSGIARNPHRILKNVDVIFNALHGEYGEDGKVQTLLDAHNIPYTGSGALPSAIGMNKILSKKRFASKGLKVPKHIHVEHGENLDKKLEELLSKFSTHHYIVKPATGGSSLGISVVKNLSSIEKAVKEALKYSSKVMIEEFVQGREATCGVLESSTQGKLYPLPPVEIKYPPKAKFFDYTSKYTGESEEICPGNFTEEETEALQAIAMKAHQALGLRHYSRADMIITPENGMYLLEVNTLPGLTPMSLYPKSLSAVGLTFSEFLDHLITLALR